MTSNKDPTMLIIIFILFLAFVVFYLCYLFSTLSYLKRHHNAAWVELGSPSFLNNSIYNNFTVLQFLTMGRYKALGDPVLNARFRVIRIMLVGSIVILFGLSRIASARHSLH